MPSDRTAKASFKKYLKNAQKSWKNSKEYHEERFGKKVEGGDYIALLSNMDVGINTSKEGEKRLIVKPKWEILEGEYKGFEIFGGTLWLHTVKSQAWFRNWCVEIDREPPEDLEEELEDFCKQCIKKPIYCTIRIVYKDEDTDPWPDKVNIVGIEKDYEPEEDELRKENDEDSLDDMKRKELVEYVEENGLDKKIDDYDDLSKEDLLNAIKNLVETPLSNEKKEDDKEEVDLSGMSRKQLVKLIENEGFKIDDYDDLGKSDLIKAIMNVQESGSSKDDDEDIEISLDDFEDFCKHCVMSPKSKDSKSKNAMIKYLKQFEFDEVDKLRKKDIKFLTNLGLEDLIK